MALEINSQYTNNGIWKVDLVGDLDIFSSPNLKKELVKLLKEKQVDIQINCEKLDYIDSTGLGVLISAYQDAKSVEAAISIINAKANIKKIFTITDLDTVFNIGEENDGQY